MGLARKLDLLPLGLEFFFDIPGMVIFAPRLKRFPHHLIHQRRHFHFEQHWRFIQRGRCGDVIFFFLAPALIFVRVPAFILGVQSTSHEIVYKTIVVLLSLRLAVIICHDIIL